MPANPSHCPRSILEVLPPEVVRRIIEFALDVVYNKNINLKLCRDHDETATVHEYYSLYARITLTCHAFREIARSILVDGKALHKELIDIQITRASSILQTVRGFTDELAGPIVLQTAELSGMCGPAWRNPYMVDILPPVLDFPYWLEGRLVHLFLFSALPKLTKQIGRDEAFFRLNKYHSLRSGEEYEWITDDGRILLTFGEYRTRRPLLLGPQVEDKKWGAFSISSFSIITRQGDQRDIIHEMERLTALELDTVPEGELSLRRFGLPDDWEFGRYWLWCWWDDTPCDHRQYEPDEWYLFDLVGRKVFDSDSLHIVDLHL